MKLLIDIPEEEYHNYLKMRPAYPKGVFCYIEAIQQGTPLPEGHGRLIDADETLKAMDTWDKFGFDHTCCFVREPKDDYITYVHYDDMVKAVNGMPTIIEADKEADNE